MNYQVINSISSLTLPCLLNSRGFIYIPSRPLIPTHHSNTTLSFTTLPTPILTSILPSQHHPKSPISTSNSSPLLQLNSSQPSNQLNHHTIHRSTIPPSIKANYSTNTQFLPLSKLIHSTSMKSTRSMGVYSFW